MPESLSSHDERAVLGRHLHRHVLRDGVRQGAPRSVHPARGLHATSAELVRPAGRLCPPALLLALHLGAQRARASSSPSTTAAPSASRRAQAGVGLRERELTLAGQPLGGGEVDAALAASEASVRLESSLEELRPALTPPAEDE